MSAENRFPGETAARHQEDLRGQVSQALLNRLDTLTADALAILPHAGQVSLDRDFCERLANWLIRLLALAVRDAAVDERGMLVAQLRGAVLERSLETGHLFTLAYLVERAVLDELALDETIGATTEVWPVVAQLVRRGSFEYLALFGSRTHLDSTGSFTDALTTLHTRAWPRSTTYTVTVSAPESSSDSEFCCGPISASTTGWRDMATMRLRCC
jgi:hypothetical protein